MARVKQLQLMLMMLTWLPGTSACFCLAGTYCDKASNNCLDCHSGTFISENGHSKPNCDKWSTNPGGQHVVVIKNGSSIRDIEYGCESGYEKKVFSGGGEWECRGTTTTTSTTPTTTSTPFTTWSKPETTVRTGSSSQEFETEYIITICVSIFAVAVIVIAVVLYKKCIQKKIYERKRDNKNKVIYSAITNPVLETFFTAVVNVLGEEERKPFIDILYTPDTTFDRNQNSEFKTLLCSWASCYPELNHSLYIVRALKEKGYKLPEDLNASDLAAVTDSLTKAGQLNLEFKLFCSKLWEELGVDANELVTRLEIKADFDIRMQSNSNRLDVALPLCLAKWAFMFPYVHNHNRDWDALTILKEKLVESERNDLAEKFEHLASDVYKKMEIFIPLQNGAAPDEIALIS